METANLPPLGGLGIKSGGHGGERRQTYGSVGTTATTYTVGVGGQGLFATKVKKEDVDASDGKVSSDSLATNSSSIDDDDVKDFEQFSTLNIELTADHVPLGEILERLQSSDADNGDSRNNFIRLHAVTTDSAASTISATLNVATLDLSSGIGGAFQHHFGELNDMLFSFSKSSLAAAATLETDPSSSPGSSSSVLSSPSFSPSINVPESCSTTNFLNNNNNNSIFSPGDNSSECNNKRISSFLLSPSTPVTSPPNTAVVVSNSFDPNKASPQECSLCNKMFGNASALAKHRLTHSDERKYLCTVCHKAFKRQDHLNGHLLTHRNKKPFECTTEGCNKSYCDARSLRRHRENHHSAAVSREDKMVSPASSVTSSGDFDDKSMGSDSFDSPRLTATAVAAIASKSMGADVAGPAMPPAEIPSFNILESYMNSDNKESAVGKLTAAGVVLPPVLTGASASREMQPAEQQTVLTVSPASATTTMVECTICSRRFKNIPALNGHMRLHGGYYRKDIDKKCDPPLPRPPGGLSYPSGGISSETLSNQTVSDNVRSLIEEKIIQKRKSEPVAQPKCQNVAASGVKFSSVCVPSMSCSNPTQCSTTVTYINEPPSKICRTTSDVENKSSLDNLVFPVLPQPDTSKLLANLQMRQQQHHNNCTLEQTPSAAAAPQLPNVPLPNSRCYSVASAKTSSISATPTTNPINPVISHNRSIVAASSSSSLSSSSLLSPSTYPALFTSSSSSSLLPVSSSSSSFSSSLSSFPMPASSSASSSSSLLAVARPTMTSQHGTYNNLLKVDTTKLSAPRIGPDYQATLLPLIREETAGTGGISQSVLVDGETEMWSPRWADDLTPDQLEMYLRTSSSVAAGGGLGLPAEEALRILANCRGNVFQATQEVLRPGLKVEVVSGWSSEDVDLFYEALCRNRKDFVRIAADIPGKTAKQCVEFYYAWKNLCREESQSFKGIISGALSQEDPSSASATALNI